MPPILQTTQTTLFPQSRIKFLENALLIKDIENKILIIADLHIGYEESVIETGIFPRIQTHDIIASLSKIFDKLNKQNIRLDKIIILGDLKHEYGKISEAEWRETLYVLDFISKKSKEIIFSPRLFHTHAELSFRKPVMNLSSSEKDAFIISDPPGSKLNNSICGSDSKRL